MAEAPTCPECGRRVPDERTVRLTPDEVYCTPLRCSAWRTAAIYDRAQGRFVAVEEAAESASSEQVQS